MGRLTDAQRAALALAAAQNWRIVAERADGRRLVLRGRLPAPGEAVYPQQRTLVITLATKEEDSEANPPPPPGPKGRSAGIDASGLPQNDHNDRFGALNLRKPQSTQ
jgi:hypothetical protein